MNSLESPNRVTKRHARVSYSGKMALNLDLNFPPAECLLLEETHGSMHPQISRGACQPCLPTRQQQGASAPSSSFIDLDLIEDEVVALSSSEGFPTGRSRTRRKQPVTVILEEDREINFRRSVIIFEDQVASSSLIISKKQRTTVNCDLYPDVEEEDHGSKKLTKPNVVEPVKVIEHPTFTCPICMDKLVEPASTICGHIFCVTCTKASIQAQKKCPTCRRKLTMKSFHRIYLPV